MTLLDVGLAILFGVLAVMALLAIGATMFSSMLSRKEERRLSVPPREAGKR